MVYYVLEYGLNRRTPAKALYLWDIFADIFMHPLCVHVQQVDMLQNNCTCSELALAIQENFV